MVRCVRQRSSLVEGHVRQDVPCQGASLSSQCSIAFDRAARVFGVDGSLLAHLVPVEWVRQVLAEAQMVSRTRRTSAVAGVYLVLALTLFPGVSTTGVFEKLSGRWGRPGAQVPSASSWKQRRAALGERPFRLLFDRLRQAGGEVSAARWRGWLVCAWDGTMLQAPDTPANAEAFTKRINQRGPVGSPLVRLVVLVACGSRALIDAAVDATGVGETVLAVRLVGSLRPGMLLLADRGFPGFVLWCRAAGSGAQLLWRVKRDVHFTVFQVLPDGSALAWWRPSSSIRKAEREQLPAQMRVRVVTGWITVIDADGTRRSEPYRLVTTLTDHRRYPAVELVKLYGRRWQVELVIKGLKCVQGAARLRSRTPDGVRQEVWAWLCTHQLLRIQAARAAEHAAGPTPVEVAQISFTTLVQRIRDAVIRTGGRYGSGERALADLHQATCEDITPLDIRIRVYDRVVKHPVAKFPSKKPQHRGRTVAYEYSIEQPGATTSTNTPAEQIPHTKINP